MVPRAGDEYTIRQSLHGKEVYWGRGEVVGERDRDSDPPQKKLQKEEESGRSFVS